MTKNKDNNNANLSSEFISISFKSFVVDIKIKCKNFYSQILDIKDKGVFEKIFIISENFLKKDMLGKKLYLSILLTNDIEMIKINKKSRNKAHTTNVLAFPYLNFINKNNLKHEFLNEPIILGDIVISLDRITEEAKIAEKKVLDHFIHILIHGFLHLLGFDHKTEGQARKMENIETKILNHLGIKDPYINL